MSRDSDLPARKTIRLRRFDYSSAGLYFITICAFRKRPLFGSISDGHLIPSASGKIVTDCWFDLPNHHINLSLDAFVLMPNHLHGILVLNTMKSDLKVDAENLAVGAGLRPARRISTLSEIVRAFKTFSAKKINLQRMTTGEPVWQRNYYERVVRDGRELDNIRRYISENPGRWEWDRENPAPGKKDQWQVWESD